MAPERPSSKARGEFVTAAQLTHKIFTGGKKMPTQKIRTSYATSLKDYTKKWTRNHLLKHSDKKTALREHGLLSKWIDKNWQSIRNGMYDIQPEKTDTTKMRIIKRHIVNNVRDPDAAFYNYGLDVAYSPNKPRTAIRPPRTP